MELLDSLKEKGIFCNIQATHKDAKEPVIVSSMPFVNSFGLLSIAREMYKSAISQGKKDV